MKSPHFIYLDYAAATPMAAHVLAVMQPYFSDDFYNPSSPYEPAVKVRREYEAAKQRLAETFGGKGDEVVVTAGATESINLAFHHVGGHIVTSAIEHPAVLEAAKQHDHSLAKVDQKGRVDEMSIKSLIRPDTELISISLANSELGTIQPLKKIAALIEIEKKARAEQGNPTPLLLHCDASQGFGQIDIHVSRLGIDLLTLNAGKIYGPKQVGLLWIKSSVKIAPTIVGGGQERGLRSGTENVAGTIGFTEAAVHAAKHQAAENDRLRNLRDQLEKILIDAFPAMHILGSKKHRLPGHLSVAFEGIDAERIIFVLEARNILVATGSACSANKHTASHVLRAIELDERCINGSLRLSLGKGTTDEDIKVAGGEIINAIRNEYERLAR